MTIAIIIALALAALWACSGILGARRTAAAAEQAQLVAGLAAYAAADTTEQAPPWRTAPWASGTGQHPTVGTQPVCACGGRRCRAHREGRDCATDALTQRSAYWRRLPAGRHTLALAVARWWAGSWADADLPVRLRRDLGRIAGTRVVTL